MCRSAVVGHSDVTLVGTEYSLQAMKPPREQELKIQRTDGDKHIPVQKIPLLKPKSTKIDMVENKIMATTGDATIEIDEEAMIFEATGEISLKADGDIIIEGGPNIKINC